MNALLISRNGQYMLWLVNVEDQLIHSALMLVMCEVLFHVCFRTSVGRLRAWLRLAMMQKTLVKYFQEMIDLKDQLLVYVSLNSSIFVNFRLCFLTSVSQLVTFLHCATAMTLSDGLGLVKYLIKNHYSNTHWRFQAFGLEMLFIMLLAVVNSMNSMH